MSDSQPRFAQEAVGGGVPAGPEWPLFCVVEGEVEALGAFDDGRAAGPDCGVQFVANPGDEGPEFRVVCDQAEVPVPEDSSWLRPFRCRSRWSPGGEVAEFHFLEEYPGVYEGAGGDEEAGAGIYEARGYLAELVARAGHFDGVAGVRAAAPDHVVDAVREGEVGADFPFSFGAELCAGHYGYGHGLSFLKSVVPVCLGRTAGIYPGA